MINTNNLLQAVKELIYNTHLDGIDDVSKLKAIVKFNWLAMAVMADALEIKADNEIVNIYFVTNLFKWYSVYAKSYNFLLDTTKMIEISEDDKSIILKMIEELTEIDDADVIIDKLNSLLEYKISESNSGETTEESKEHEEVEEISDDNNSEQANKEKQELPVEDVKKEKETERVKQGKTVKQVPVNAKNKSRPIK